MPYTTSTAFFEAITDAGITHCFVNLGSDHPSIMDAIVRGQRNAKAKFPRIITCPSEATMSMADGCARVTGQPQCVIVHVDVGTQALGAAMHNASVGRAPVLIFAGLSPFTLEGEMRGSRTEFIHWLQDVPDQRAIVSQYCRYTAEIRTGVNVKQMVARALQFATSDPEGPVYLCGAREVMEAELRPYTLRRELWRPVEMGGMPAHAAEEVASALAGAATPLLITGYSGRHRLVPAALVRLADTVPALRVLDTAGSEMSFPGDHPAWLGLKQGAPEALVAEADVIVVLHCDVPWIPTLSRPKADARVFHIDVDPLKQGMPLFYIDAEARYRADALTSVRQITAELQPGRAAAAALAARNLDADREARRAAYAAKIEAISAAARPRDDGSFGAGHLGSVLRTVCPEDTVWAVEAVTNTGHIHNNIRPTRPGSWLNCGGGGLGWSGGAALGIKLAVDARAGGKGPFVCQVVGDGTYLFSFPGSVYWISRRYGIPVLTIVLNNKGWNAPRASYTLIHPDGEGTRVGNEELNISFAPVPDYGGIARAAGAGDIHALKVEDSSELEAVLEDAVARVQAGMTAVVDCRIVQGG
ncbi:Acetolactate synthase large subunit or other thiamine pyrophosphate-requiring enzyme [Geosmithia morbida]|uniref:Acetolactate synthase large subunit or other thiamine pyrophosphate-requiring enzyme n=1 Tax=Geosmithia morbida TaxID=1094350 RepID=A0A9P4YX07_9HYPO|nr:Acetolactate synthase large subunit or other thiamine pyrophosphate-requiring enzyme [Geosmithia morbida]KAF4124643.1 Acetolactate synthase large subunit or other thiamine pyrophosphate-requiring enzyme [Geosmithia morbida]